MMKCIPEDLKRRLDLADKYCKLSEQLGVDLTILVKAFKNGIYSKGGYYGPCCIENEIHFIKPENITMAKDLYTEVKHKEDDFYIEDDNELCLFELYYENVLYSVRVKDYGRTWALTKEEL